MKHIKMNDDFLKELRNALIGMNDEGNFVFKVTKNGHTTTYGPVNFGSMVSICWSVMDDYKREMNR